MNPDVFFKNFELLADAPNGIQKLRELILQLAVMGKLVLQDPNDEPVSVLHEKVNDDKKRKDKGKKIKRSNSLPSISENEIIFKIPESWEFDRLGNIAQTITKGSTPTSYGYQFQEEGIRFVKVENVKNGRIVIENIKDFISEEAHEFQSRSKLESGDILFSIAGTIGETCVVQDQDLPANTNQALAIIRGTNVVFESDYLKVQFDSFVSNAVKSKARGGAMNNISLGDLKDLIVFIPPLAEQKRIVSKVDELMALCDKLEARRQKKQEVQSKLNSAALDRMLSAENQEEFEQYWQRICENFDLLYDSPENVEKLRQTILQLAVQGKLVPPNPEDEPASVLIGKIKAEKEKLLKEGRIKQKNQLSFLEVDEQLFETPINWEWCKLGDIFSIVSGNAFKSGDFNEKNGVRVVKITNVGVGNFVETNDYLPIEFRELYPQFLVNSGDILIALTRPYISNGLKVCFCPTNYENSLLNQRVAAIKEIFIELSLDFVYYYLKSMYVLDYVKEKSRAMNQPNLSIGDLNNLLLPLPPLNEQKRIVEKVEQLMGLCNELEAKLRKEREDSDKLMEAVVKDLLEGAVTKKTELENPIPLQAAAIQLK